MTIRGGGHPKQAMVLKPVSRMGPPPRSFAADAHDCIMVRSLRTYRIQGCGAMIAPDGKLPSDHRPDHNQRSAAVLVPVKARPGNNGTCGQGRARFAALANSLTKKAPYKACSAFTRVTACTLALSPIRDTLIEGFSHFVTSMTAPTASGWSGRRVGLAPTGKRRLSTAHTLNGPSSERILNSTFGRNGTSPRALVSVR
jgi:hypothetical protein